MVLGDLQRWMNRILALIIHPSDVARWHGQTAIRDHEVVGRATGREWVLSGRSRSAPSILSVAEADVRRGHGGRPHPVCSGHSLADFNNWASPHAARYAVRHQIISSRQVLRLSPSFTMHLAYCVVRPMNTSAPVSSLKYTSSPPSRRRKRRLLSMCSLGTKLKLRDSESS